MRITIICYARFRDVFGEESIVEVPDSATILDAVRLLAGRVGPDADLLLTPEGLIRDYVMVVHQGSRILP